MDKDMATRIQTLLWDMPIKKRTEAVRTILDNPKEIVQDDQLFIRALGSLSWYELISLVGPEDLNQALSEQTISRLFPPKRRTYYTNARRLLSKYALSPAGQNS
jgi:hypothetical protein